MSYRAERRRALKKFDERVTVYVGKLRKAESRWKLSDADYRFLRQILIGKSLHGHLAMSNTHVRWTAANSLMRAFLWAFKHRGSRRFLWVTFAWNEGMTWERQPEIDLIKMHSRVSDAVRRSGLSGVAAHEVDVLRNITGENGQRLLFHVHALCWLKGGEREIHVARKKLENSTAFPNRFLKAGVKVKKVGITAQDFANIAGYMLKCPYTAKNRVPNRTFSGNFNIRGTAKGFRPASAMRLAEVWSHISAYDTVFGIGKEGGSIRRRWKKEMRDYERHARHAPGDNYLDKRIDLGARWWSIRNGNGSANLGPCRIATRASSRLHPAAPGPFGNPAGSKAVPSI